MKTMLKGEAEDVAIKVLAAIASDQERVARLLDLTGHQADRIRRAAAERDFLRGVTHYVVGWEPLLLEIASEVDLKADDLVAAAAALGAIDPN